MSSAEAPQVVVLVRIRLPEERTFATLKSFRASASATAATDVVAAWTRKQNCPLRVAHAQSVEGDVVEPKKLLADSSLVDTRVTTVSNLSYREAIVFVHSQSATAQREHWFATPRVIDVIVQRVTK